jgi:divalent metal cation (Fe/Co/Zn/Cd) transporter
MSIEAALSLFAAWRARSPALLAFGGDSAIELVSAVVVLWSFRAVTSEHADRKAARIAGALLFALAASVVTTSLMALLGYSEARPSLRTHSSGRVHADARQTETATFSGDV